MRAGPIKLVVTDLDNTLYDWYASFVPAFYAMVHQALPILDVREDVLLDELRLVHCKHGDSEHPFAILETPSFVKRIPPLSKDEMRARLEPAFRIFDQSQSQALKLYKTVADSLQALRDLQVQVVAYTDARVSNSLTRLKQLGIDALLNRLYAPAHVFDVDEPHHAPDGFVRLLVATDRKPNPATLGDIFSDFGVAPFDSLYVGDSLSRDIYMAKLAGAHAAWAKYGTQYDATLWPKLVRVTHWTDADVNRENDLREKTKAVRPDCTLDQFSDIFLHYNFGETPQ